MDNTMRNIIGAFLCALCLGITHQSIAAKPADGESSDVKRYLIAYPKGNKEALTAYIEAVGGRVVFDYSSVIDGLAADLNREGYRKVRQSGLVTRVEEDAVRKLHALPSGFPVEPFPEFVPWGADRVAADTVWSTAPNQGAADDGIAGADVAASSITGTGAVVGVLDTGVDFGHPDLAGQLISFSDGVTRDFLEGDSDPTDNTNGHGTSVTSNIVSADNGVGVIGVAPGAKVSPYRVCDIFCPLSAIIGGLVQAVLDDVDVINMSFGGPAAFNLEASAVQAANANGITLVASAGNSGSQQPSFPAAYDTVIAVGATDINDNAASFTNFGGWVDVTAPGVAIASATCQGCGRQASLEEISPTSRTLQANAMAGSAVGDLTGAEIVDVGRGCDGDGLASDPDGKVALIIRGACTFAEKVDNAEAAGAAGTVIFNNGPGNFFGTLGDFSSAGPSVSISGEDGTSLASDIDSATTTVNLAVIGTDYELVNGTSFSGPHVAAVAALVKSVDPGLSPIEVRKIIQTTAEPVGPTLIFGNGMVRADNAVSVVE